MGKTGLLAFMQGTCMIVCVDVNLLFQIDMNHSLSVNYVSPQIVGATQIIQVVAK